MIFFRRLGLILLLFIALLPTLMPHPLPQRNENFSLEAISAQIPFHPEWECRPLSTEERNEVENALSQSYHYLGGGGQCFSFVSGDEKYVIKFFKQKAFATPVWMDHFALPFLINWMREKKIGKKGAKRNRAFKAFKLSFDFLSAESGLLYVHLNQTQHLQKTLSFLDDSGNEHLLNLDELEFVVQKKADLAYHVLDQLIQNNDIVGAKQAIDQLLSLNIKLYQKGFRNRDPNFRNNWGFIGARGMLIDVGRIMYCQEISDPKVYKGEILQMNSKFRFYLSNKHPELVSHFDKTIANIMNSNSD